MQKHGSRELTREYLATIAEAREYLATIAEARCTSTVDEDYESLEAEWMREYLVEIDAVGERESDAINQNLENKKEEDMTDD